MRIICIALATLLLAGCSSAQTEFFSEGHCTKVENTSFWSSGTAMICFDDSGKLLGFGQSSGESPASLASSTANAAIIGAGVAVGGALITGTKTTTP